MRTAVALMALMTGEGSDIVYVSRRGRRFHEAADCRALGAGHMIFACRCGDRYCGCAADRPPVPEGISIGLAAVRDLQPCAACYPDFQEIALQLPSGDDFGHRPFDEYEASPVRASHIVCKRCIVWFPFTETHLMGKRVPWPCTSAVVLGLANREESVS